GVTLRNDDSTECIPKLARHFLISRTSEVVAEPNLCIGLRWFQKNTPTIIRHLHVIEVGPTLRANIDRGTQPDILLLKAFGTHFTPPVDVVWQPLFKRALKLLIVFEIYVIRNAGV